MGHLFVHILGRILPLYGLILLGYLAGRYLEIRKEAIAKLLIYVIVPGVVFYGVLNTPLDPGRLSLPVLIFSLCSLLAFGALAVGGAWFPAPTRHIFAFAAGTGNMGYFGLPVATFILGEQALGPVVFAILGLIVFENTLGFFITARGHYSAKESLRRVLRLPSIYAIALSIGLNAAGVRAGELITLLGTSFRGTYTVLGMMLVGLAISEGMKAKPDFRFLSLSFISKFVLWPALMFAIVQVDVHVFHFYDPLVHRILMIMSAVPLAANTVAVATELKTEPEKAALAVLVSTFAALLIIPLVSSALM